MQHFHIIVAIMSPFPQDPRSEQFIRETLGQVDDAP